MRSVGFSSGFGSAHWKLAKRKLKHRTCNVEQRVCLLTSFRNDTKQSNALSSVTTTKHRRRMRLFSEDATNTHSTSVLRTEQLRKTTQTCANMTRSRPMRCAHHLILLEPRVNGRESRGDRLLAEAASAVIVHFGSIYDNVDSAGPCPLCSAGGTVSAKQARFGPDLEKFQVIVDNRRRFACPPPRTATARERRAGK